MMDGSQPVTAERPLVSQAPAVTDTAPAKSRLTRKRVLAGLTAGWCWPSALRCSRQAA